MRFHFSIFWCAALVAAPAFAQSQAPSQTQCLALVDAALAEDIRTATGQAEKRPWSEMESLFRATEQAWAEATKHCDGDLREQALINQAEAKRVRAQAAGQATSPACEQASGSAVRLMDFAKEAWTAKRWEDAAMWSRKADLAWESALAQCTGDKREEATAKRAAARLDAHNAVNCAPRWNKATELTAALKSELPALGAAEKIARRDQIEVAWDDAAKVCKGVAGERAQASALAFAQERGDRPLTAQPSARAAIASSNALQRQTSGDVTYIGPFVRDAEGYMEGTGRVEWANGDRYEGPIKAGMAHGKGFFVWKSGQRYEGELVEGRPSGLGKMSYVSGDSYEGTFSAGVPHGQGRYAWKNGDAYTGSWSDGQKHGHGRYVWASGKVWEGEYAKDERLAEGEVVLARATPQSE